MLRKLNEDESVVSVPQDKNNVEDITKGAKTIADIDIDTVAKALNVDYNVITKEQLKKGIEVELEHGTKHPDFNITNDNLMMTAKIALVHLRESPSYYNELEKMEKKFKDGKEAEDKEEKDKK